MVTVNACWIIKCVAPAVFSLLHEGTGVTACEARKPMGIPAELDKELTIKYSYSVKFQVRT